MTTYIRPSPPSMTDWWLEAGDIRLVRSSWLLTLPEDYRIQRRQDLEALERSGTSPSPPLLSPKEAVALIRKGDRSAGSLSYGWPLQQPDPTGHGLRSCARPSACM